MADVPATVVEGALEDVITVRGGVSFGESDSRFVGEVGAGIPLETLLGYAPDVTLGELDDGTIQVLKPDAPIEGQLSDRVALRPLLGLPHACVDVADVLNNPPLTTIITL